MCVWLPGADPVRRSLGNPRRVGDSIRNRIVRALQPLILNQPTGLAVVVGPNFHRMHRPFKERKKKQKRKKGCYYYLHIFLRVVGDSNTIRGFSYDPSVVYVIGVPDKFGYLTRITKTCTPAHSRCQTRTQNPTLLPLSCWKWRRKRSLSDSAKTVSLNRPAPARPNGGRNRGSQSRCRPQSAEACRAQKHRSQPRTGIGDTARFPRCRRRLPAFESTPGESRSNAAVPVAVKNHLGAY